MLTMPRNERWFWAYVTAFALIVILFVPRTYTIEDEFNILSLSVALSKGTVLLDVAGNELDADLLYNGHRISKFSPFHAALFTPAVMTNWRFAFVIAPLFAIAGAFVIRRMLCEDRLSSGWVAVYFLCAGLWFYSRTVMAAVPASVMVLLGASLLIRNTPRPIAAGAALSVGGLFHPWMIPIASALATGWWLDAPKQRLRQMMLLALGAAPGVALLLLYNNATTGSPFKNVYSLLGTQYVFHGRSFTSFFPFYALSLLVMPLAGWAALSPRWSRGFGIPLAILTVMVMASFYYFRDGLGYGIAGLLPAQRFLIPASLLACVPAARFLAHRFGASMRFAPAAGFACFVIGFAAVSIGHTAYVDAHATVQEGIRANIPDGSRVVVGERAFKEFAPVLGTWKLLHVRDNRLPTAEEREAAYVVWIGAPGQTPPQEWFGSQAPRRVEARSWVWNRDVWIGVPGSHRTADASGKSED
jgi:hypothetical protein